MGFMSVGGIEMWARDAAPEAGQDSDSATYSRGGSEYQSRGETILQLFYQEKEMNQTLQTS